MLITRSTWGAAPSLRPPLVDELPWPRLWLHHTAGPSGGKAQVKEVQRQHQARGWRDTAYNVLVADDGVYEGIGIGHRHLNEDTGKSGTVCLVGNFEANQIPEHMIERTAWLVAHGILSGWWATGLTGGHRDLEATACPGRHAYAVIGQINTRAAGIIAGLVTPPPPETVPDPPAVPRKAEAMKLLFDKTTWETWAVADGKATPVNTAAWIPVFGGDFDGEVISSASMRYLVPKLFTLVS